MFISGKTTNRLIMYWYALFFAFILMIRYGKQLADWVLNSLYDFFIQKTF